MRKLAIIMTVVMMSLFVSVSDAFAKGSSHHSRGTGASSSSHVVRSYTRKNGTHVKSHRSSNADGNISNNWTTKGNTNPYTGKAGSH